MATTCDLFLDSRITVTQPAEGFRAGIDAVLLAAALRAKPGQSLLELGCGAGTAMLCAAARLTECQFTGLDIDPAMVGLAQRNIAANGFGDRMRATIGDVADPVHPDVYDRVFFNPPFFDDPAALRAPKPAKQTAYIASTATLPDWTGFARRVLKPKGRVAIIHRADALGDLLAALAKGWGDIAIKPVQPRIDAPAKRVLVTARKGAKGPLTLLSPLVMHDDKGGKYSVLADAILRGRATIEMG
tara:strand:+ start:1406 stop:2137 length:732 start_codon:yes stop_codon:yes gene_type:complete